MFSVAAFVSIQLVFLASRKERRLKSPLAIHSTEEFRQPLCEPHFCLNSCKLLAFIREPKKPKLFECKGSSDFRQPPRKFAPAWVHEYLYHPNLMISEFCARQILGEMLPIKFLLTQIHAIHSNKPL